MTELAPKGLRFVEIIEIMDRLDIPFVSNFDMAYKTIKRISVRNLTSFGPTKTELGAKKIGKFPIMLYGKMGWAVGVLLPTNIAATILV